MLKGSLIRYIIIISAITAPAIALAQTLDSTAVPRVIQDTVPTSLSKDTSITPDLRVDDESDFEEITDDLGAELFDLSGSSDGSGGSTGLIDYGSVDSNYLDIINQELHLYTEAYVRYTDYEVHLGGTRNLPKHSLSPASRMLRPTKFYLIQKVKRD